MKIAVIAHGLSGGGAERVASIVSNYFAEQGHDVLFVAAYSEEREYELHSNIEYSVIKTSSKIGMLRLIERSFKIKNVVKKFRADVAFSFISYELIPLVLSGIPVIPSLRTDPNYLEAQPLKWHMRQFAYVHSQKIIFQTSGAKNYFNEKIRNKGVIIGNPLKDNLPLWDEANHKKQFITACRITPQKNLPMLINAFVKFHKNHPDYILNIFGDSQLTEYKEQIRKQILDNNAADYIFLKGHSTDIHTEMQQSEVFILTSNFEGLSNSMLEALAIGIPCICTDCPPGGAKEYIVSNENGILVPVGGEDELLEAMNAIADSDDLKHKFSINSRKVREELSREKICSQWEQLIF